MKTDPHKNVYRVGGKVFPFDRDHPRSANEQDELLTAHSLLGFIPMAWHVIEPATDYVDGDHIKAICDHLEAVTNGDIRNLLINLPPRHMKSLTVSVFWPVWEWINTPSRRWLFASYAASLSIRDSLRCRRLIESDWFQQRWGDRFQLTTDQNEKMRFDNDKTGCRIATSVGGSATGEGGDRVVVDDPHNISERESDAVREAALIWWDQTMSTRLNDPKTGARVIVMQRIHEKDLAGHVLAQAGYVHLCLPAEFDPARKCVTSIGWHDERTIEGQLLWPQRMTPSEISDFKLRLGPTGYAGQFQQQPVPAGGGRFRQEWFRYYRMEKCDAEMPQKCDAERGRRGDAVKEGECDAETRGHGDAEKMQETSSDTSAPSSVSASPRLRVSVSLHPSPLGPLSLRERAGVRGNSEEVGPKQTTSPATPPHPNPLPRGEGAKRGEEAGGRAGHYILIRSDGTELRVCAGECHRFAVMDPAGTERNQNTRPCYTVIQVWDITPAYDMILVHQYRDQVQAPDAAAAAIRIAREFVVDYLGIEKDGLGLGIVQTVKRTGITVRPLKAKGSKEARSETAEIRMAAGTVYFPAGAPFLWDLEQELIHFPYGEYCDQVDALAHAALQVQKLGGPPGAEQTFE